MKKSNPIVKIVVFGVIAVALYGVGIFTKLWDALPKNGTINISWQNILRMLALIFATLFIEQLVVHILKNLKSENRRTQTVTSIVSNLLKYVAAIVIFCGVLSMLGVNVATILASLGVLALIIGFGAESLIADVVTGMFILLDNQYNVGDIIEINGFRGYVSEIGIRTTCVTDTGGNVKIINNSDMKNILNRSDKASVAVSTIDIPYDTDLEALEEKLPGLLEEIHQKHADAMLAPPEYLGVQTLGSSGITLKFIVKVEEQNIFRAVRILNHDLLLGFRKLGVECPFPQLDLHQR